MTGGQKLLDDLRAQTGSKGGGIPWIVFFDADGKVLATSDAPEGNTGFPSKDEEIAWFVEMLGKARVNLTEGDVATLKQLLVDWREASKQRRGH